MEGIITMEFIIAGITSILIGVYLIITLLYPEKF